MKDINILGIIYGGHDTSAALLLNGKIIAACEQERFSRDKHSRRFPIDAIAECLRLGAITLENVDEIAFSFDPFLYIRETYLKPAMEHQHRIQFLIHDIDRIKTFSSFEELIRKETGYKGEICFYHHHLCHLAGAYYPSGLDPCLLISNDGVGEIATGIIGAGELGNITVLDESNFYPDSLGLFYSAITFYLGWKHHCDEGIIMGLAPYGDFLAKLPGTQKTYYEIFEEIIQETGEFSYKIDLSWIEYHRIRDTWVSQKFKDTFGPKRDGKDPLTQHHKNIAAALQKRIEVVMIHILKRARKKFGYRRLALSGGVSLNCSLNGKIEKENIFDEIYVQPASGDSGASVGACYLAYKKRREDYMPCKDHNPYLGSRFSDQDILRTCENLGVAYGRCEDIYKFTAEQLADGKIVGWFQDGAEFGPRALGNRSILVKPYPASMRDYLNKRVKFREEFRPFAPAILERFTKDYFDIRQTSPHMLIATQAKGIAREKIPATVHVDGSCRVQSVSMENNPRFAKLLEAFYAKTGCPVLLNTSFNVKGEPMVNSPEDAIRCVLSTNIDLLVMGDMFFCR